MTARYHFLARCVEWPAADVNAEGGLCDMIAQAVSISRESFARHTDPAERRIIESNLGYSIHGSPYRLTMGKDPHVTYHRSLLHGVRCYFFKWSAIEYVFTKGIIWKK
jgi:hypothetical protein